MYVLQWRRDVAFAGFDVPIQMDVSARKMIFGVQADPARRDRLIKVGGQLNDNREYSGRTQSVN